MRRLLQATRRIWLHQGGVSTVEFAILCAPFIYLLTGVVQFGVFFMVQSALDTGVLRTAEMLRTNFTTGSTATLPSASSLKATVAARAGGLVSNNATLSVEIRQLTGLSASTLPITDGITDYGTTTSTLVIRAKTTIPAFVPGLSALTLVVSSAMVRRQGT